MRDYELMLILDPTLDEEGTQAAADRVHAFISGRGGEVVSVDSAPPLGRRRLAYPIKRHRDGIYSITRLRMDATVADELDRSLKLTDQVIRHLLIRKD
jgi:small subunit ribosomal protein S6